MTPSTDTELDRQIKKIFVWLVAESVKDWQPIPYEAALAQIKQLIARERLEFFNTGKAVGRNAVLEFMRLHPEMSSSEVQAALQAQADKEQQG